MIESIEIIQAAGVLHRDIRSCNVLFFPYIGKYLLNDFDLAACIKDVDGKVKTLLNPSSEQAKKAPWRIRSQLKQLQQKDPHRIRYEIFWTKLDDILMFTEYRHLKGLELENYGM